MRQMKERMLSECPECGLNDQTEMRYEECPNDRLYYPSYMQCNNCLTDWTPPDFEDIPPKDADGNDVKPS